MMGTRFIAVGWLVVAGATAKAEALPELMLSRLTDGPTERIQVSGKPALLQFWASWCASCGGVRAELAGLLEEADRATQVAWVAVSVDERADEAKRALARATPARRMPVETHDTGHRLARDLGGVAVPTVLVVDGSGEILTRVEGHLGAAQRGALLAALRQATRKQKGESP